MNIEGLDYNTHREPLLMQEYGREIQKMVAHATALPTREERQACANTIIKLMSTKVEHNVGGTEFTQKLWDHLYLMSNKQLDIEWPFDVTQAEKFHDKPAPITIPDKDEHMHLRHYGRLLEKVFEKLKTMPEGKERDELTRITANQMKRMLMTWSHGSSDNEKVADDLARYTDGRIQLDLNKFKFERIVANDLQDIQKRRKRK